jgi:hypothetical protein
MTTTHDLARVLVSSWVLSGEERVIPTSDGILDLALRDAVEHGAFGGRFGTALHFVEARMGLQCLELESILEEAQQSGLASVPNPSYKKAVIEATPRVARWILSRLGVSEAEAKQWGETLRKSVEHAKKVIHDTDRAPTATAS